MISSKIKYYLQASLNSQKKNYLRLYKVLRRISLKIDKEKIHRKMKNVLEIQ